MRLATRLLNEFHMETSQPVTKHVMPPCVSEFYLTSNYFILRLFFNPFRVVPASVATARLGSAMAWLHVACHISGSEAKLGCS